MAIIIADVRRAESRAFGDKYETMEMRLHYAKRIDVAKSIAADIRNGLDMDLDNWRRRLSEVRAANGGAVYYREDYRSKVVLSWQRNIGHGHDSMQSIWYGVHIEEADLSPNAARLIARIAKVGTYDLQPAEVIKGLRAVTVAYCSRIPGFIEAEADLAIVQAHTEEEAA